jgi:N-acetylmuramoyl-L-alanine amidase
MTVTQKSLILVAILFLSVSTTGLSVSASKSAQPTTKIKSPFRLSTIVLDAGHGGRDPGNVGPERENEKDINLAITRKLAALIREKTTYDVYLTRSGDRWISLADRAHFANQFPSSQTLFISIHCNSHPNSHVHGLESYIFNLKATDKFAEELAKWENDEEVVSPVNFIIRNLYKRGVEKYSWEAARIVQSVLVSHLGARNRNRSAPDKMVRRAPFRVLVDTNMPAFLVELGYLTNKAEYKKLSSPTYQDKVVSALLRSIQQFDQATQDVNRIEARLP